MNFDKESNFVWLGGGGHVLKPKQFASLERGGGDEGVSSVGKYIQKQNTETL